MGKASTPLTVLSWLQATMTPNNARSICCYLKSLIPRAALIVSLALEQAAGAGPSAFLLITEIIVNHPGFNWASLARLSPLEWQRYIQAIARVNNNIWFGFSQDKRVAASRNLVSLF